MAAPIAPQAIPKRAESKHIKGALNPDLPLHIIPNKPSAKINSDNAVSIFGNFNYLCDVKQDNIE